VENAVQLSYQRIFYPLREMTFFSLRDLNREIGRLLENYNNMLFQRKEASRKELFQSVERTVLKPLPVGVYQLKDYTRAKVQKIGYVYFSPAGSNYAVPTHNIAGPAKTHIPKKTGKWTPPHQRMASQKRAPRG